MKTRIEYPSYTVRVVRRKLAHPPSLPPPHRQAFHEGVLQEILEERVVSSRSRHAHRGVKGKMSSYPLRPPKPPGTRYATIYGVRGIQHSLAFAGARVRAKANGAMCRVRSYWSGMLRRYRQDEISTVHRPRREALAGHLVPVSSLQ